MIESSLPTSNDQAGMRLNVRNPQSCGQTNPDAVSLPDRPRRKAQRMAIGSALLGCVSETLFETSPIVIIYLVMLQGGDGFSMFSSSIPGIALATGLIPGAGIVDRIGLKRSVGISCYVSTAALLLIAAAPLLGASTTARGMVIAGCFMLAFMRPLFTAAWFPILDDILLPRDRSDFFGIMRF